MIFEPVRVLVVDDDPDIREMLSSTLEFAGFAVTTVPGVREALSELTREPPEVLVLDVMMPGTDGFELVQLLRGRGDRLPVLFLTARDAIEDRVRGLRIGGDDYVTKPFSVVEIAARVEALVRRSRAVAEPPKGNTILRCADLSVDLSRHVVARGAATVELSPTEYRLLTYLLENVDGVVSKAQILDRVWNYDFGGDGNVVERFVANLRRKLDALGDPLIHTIRGFGYSLRAPDQR
ncbi:DNA-binding response regulator, OmpR family, contains REC and winged-helix (wHTH) domain [Curtobacterium sp. 314Chir4.1]|uniref:response regulator transcription factor n=1 Tax=Curtobacterium sp. 314Chir4.1 TaxID=1279028 RepID=UPI000BC3F598|nr:response regulator transcription factor [Curtobacterium sp. 314Chir4.1]SOC88702.1 DNA-binding response regulator, OmpR family, contains REC and winged-helix (wHTH) domain [Curtobacterium sp. 314Chir4.1]